jgi:uncharacterized membrane protein
MSFAIAICLHLLAAIVWVGGMFFAYLCLRPSLPEALEPPQIARLLDATFARFFRWIGLAVVVLLATGLYMAFTRYGFGVWPHWLYVMLVLGVAMMLMYGHVVHSPFRRLRRALASGDAAAAGRAIGQIRRLVGVNLVLGLAVAIAASAGRYWP